MTVLFTARLRLEPLNESHLDGLCAMNSLPEVMRYITGEPETREQTAAMIARVQLCWAAWGTSWWAFVEVQSGRIAGAGAVQYLRRDATPPADLMLLRTNPLELGWRLHPDFWRQGLASEAAQHMAAFAFNNLAAAELLAVRHPGQHRLRASHGPPGHAVPWARNLVRQEPGNPFADPGRVAKPAGLDQTLAS